MSANNNQRSNSDSALDIDMAEVDISFGSSGCSTPSPRGMGTSTPRTAQRHLRQLFRTAESDDDIQVKHINDNIHGHILVPPVCQAIIDTPQFDRLRGLRQLGNAHFVWPAAKHSRFEHSLGVMHLAGKMVDTLMMINPNCADFVDKLCVMMAGLCHDLGHGAFSHLWETFVHEARDGYQWCHEKTSIDMLDYIIKENDLMPVFEKFGLTELDITFVKEMIYGPFQKGDTGDDWPYVGRGPEKYFLYEIVANKISSVDVDKWDYMLRDNNAMRIGLTFDYHYFLNNIDLGLVQDRERICIRDKVVTNVMDMFSDRANLHNKGYQHKTVLKIDRMILDVLLAADEHFLLTTRSGEKFRLSEACDNIEAFSQLTDEFLLRSIQFSNDPNLAKARSILERITKRKIYTELGVMEFHGNATIPLEEARGSLDKFVEEKGTCVEKGDIVILRKRISMGMGDKNPVEKMVYFDKGKNRRILSSEQLRQNLPRHLTKETYFVILRKDDEESLNNAKIICREWVGKVKEDGDKKVKEDGDGASLIDVSLYD